MPAVFVHGVPDSSRVWKGVVARLPRRDVVTLALPGCSHWWQLERPDAVAAELDRFWAHIRPGEPRDA